MTERQSRSLPSGPTLTLEVGLYLVVLAAALALRLAGLGAHPLNDGEATQALAVLDRLQTGAPAAVPGSPAYFAVTFLSFLLFGASDATARLGPALAGTALVLVPALLRDALGRGGALAASAVLALSSTLVAASRTADGTTLALLGLALALAALWRFATPETVEPVAEAPSAWHGAGWLIGVGVALGLALAAGGAVWAGVLAVVIAGLGLAWLPGRDERNAAWRAAWRRAWALRPPWLIALGLTLLLVSTVALLYLPGLGAMAASWGAWLAGWVPGPARPLAEVGRPASLGLVFLSVYDPLVLVFGVVGAVRAFSLGHRPAQALALAAAAALLMWLLYAGRSLPGLAWVALPFAMLAGWALASLLAPRWERRQLPLVAAQASVSLALVVFAALNVAAFAQTTRGGAQINQLTVMGQVLAIPPVTPILVALLALALVGVIGYLFSLVGSDQQASLGLALTATVVLGAFTLGAGWGQAHTRPGHAAELWWAVPASAGLPRLVDTLGDVSNYSEGQAGDVDLTVLAPRASSLGWALRGYGRAQFVDRLAAEISSPVVITPASEQNPTLGSAYVGQDFALRQAWTPPASFAQWVNWLAYRRAPGTQAERVILWVRQDVQQLRSTGQP